MPQRRYFPLCICPAPTGERGKFVPFVRGKSHRTFHWCKTVPQDCACDKHWMQDGTHRRRRRQRFSCPRRNFRVSLWLVGTFSVLLPAAGWGRDATFSLRRTAEDGHGTFGRPEWIPLTSGSSVKSAGAGLLELFRSSEVLQMYHIQATGMLYEQGGLNHDMTFALTAAAFYSLERPEAKVSMAYHPTNMTISLLPVISDDGRELHWENQGASVSYIMDIDQAYWTGTSYMGETTGAFFSYAVEFSLAFHEERPRYQPFSVYKDYPGDAFVVASSCDEYVWGLLSAAQERGVRLVPAVMPQKYKIVIYSQTAPDVITLEAQRDGDGDQNGDVAADMGGGKNGTTGNSTDAGLESSSTVVNGSGQGEGNSGNGDGGGHERNLATSSSASSGYVDNGTDLGSGEGRGRPRALFGNVAFLPNGDDATTEHKDIAPYAIRHPIHLVAEVRTASDLHDSLVKISSEQELERGDRGSQLSATEPGVAAEEVTGAGSALGGVVDGGNEDGKASNEEMKTESIGELEEAAGAVPSLATVAPTSVPPVLPAAIPTAPPTVIETVVPTIMPTSKATDEQRDNWEQVVSYYQSLQLCLQERKFSFVTSLKDFAQYFDCLDDVAFISIGPHQYYKVNLTSTKLDHITQPEDLPAVQRLDVRFTWVDVMLAVWIVLIIACGVHGMLWQGGVMQHWMKASGYGQEEDRPFSDETLPEKEPPSLTRRITTEYLRFGNVFLGKTSYHFIGAPATAAAQATDESQQQTPKELVSSSTTLKFAPDKGENHDRYRRALSGKPEAEWETGAMRNGTGAREFGSGSTRNGQDDGIEMQAAWSAQDARETDKLDGGGGEHKGQEIERRGAGSLMHEGSSSSSLDGRDSQYLPSSPSEGRRKRSLIRHTEQMAPLSLAKEGWKAPPTAVVGVRSDSRNIGDFVRSPKPYAYKNLRGRGEDHGGEDDRYPVILPRDSWASGEGNGRNALGIGDDGGTRDNNDGPGGEESKVQIRSPRRNRDGYRVTSDDAR